MDSGYLFTFSSLGDKIYEYKMPSSDSEDINGQEASNKDKSSVKSTSIKVYGQTETVCLHSEARSGHTAMADVAVKEKDVCGHCDSKCKSRGKGSDGLCCDYCGHWVHASCEGMNYETYIRCW